MYLFNDNAFFMPYSKGKRLRYLFFVLNTKSKQENKALSIHLAYQLAKHTCIFKLL